MMVQTRHFASLGQFRDTLRAAQAWSARASEHQMGRAEAASGSKFPSSDITDCLLQPSYETAETAGFALCDWLTRIRQTEPNLLKEIEGSLGACPAPERTAVENLRRTIMPGYLLDLDGSMVTAFPHDAVTWAAVSHGGAHNLAHMALYQGLEVSVFHRSLGVDLLYDGAAALGSYGKVLPDPIGCQADYRVEVLDGAQCIPPKHPPTRVRSDIPKPRHDAWVAVTRSMYRAPGEDGLSAQTYKMPRDLGMDEVLELIAEDILNDAIIEGIFRDTGLGTEDLLSPYRRDLEEPEDLSP